MFICKDLRVAAVEVSDSLVHRTQTTKKRSTVFIHYAQSLWFIPPCLYVLTLSSTCNTNLLVIFWTEIQTQTSNIHAIFLYGHFYLP